MSELHIPPSAPKLEFGRGGYNDRAIAVQPLDSIFEQLDSNSAVSSLVGDKLIAIKAKFEAHDIEKKRKRALKGRVTTTETPIERSIRFLQLGTYFSWGITLSTGAYTSLLCYYYDNCQRMFGFAVAGVVAMTAQLASGILSDRQTKAKEKLEAQKNQRKQIKEMQRAFLDAFGELHQAKGESLTEMDNKLYRCLQPIDSYHRIRDIKAPKNKDNLIASLVRALPPDHPLKKHKLHDVDEAKIPKSYKGKLPPKLLRLGQDLKIGKLPNITWIAAP